MTPEDDLQRIVDAYDNGVDAVFIDGRKRILTGLKEIRVFSFNAPWETLHDFINSEEIKKQHKFSKLTGKLAIGVLGLASKGTDLTKQFFNKDFGWKKKNQGDSIFKLSNIM